MTASKARRRTGVLITSLLIGLLAVMPASADSEDDLQAAERRAAQIEAELGAANAAYYTALAKYESTLDEISATKAQMAKTQERMNRIRAALAERAREAYERGAAGTLEILLSSSSFSQFSDRVEFLDRMSEGDAELILRAQVTQDQLTRQEAHLRELSAEQQAAKDALARQKAIIDASFAEAQGLVRKYAAEVAADRAAAAALARLAGVGTVVQGSALQACPVAGPHSYYDDFGNPRSGGRSHQGNDILAPYGTPVVAAQPGTFQATSNSLGGLSAFVYGDRGDMTYYAHLSAYSGIGSGSHVGAGTQIGAVGTSGNASGGPPHLHFEYHPGGGGAVNPYPYLNAVC